MKRENEFAVGLVVIAALALVVGGALWLSGAHLGKTEAVYTARFRTVGGLGAGSPVVLRGVRVGRIEAIRLAPGNWVEADIKIYSGVTPPAKPAVIAASASLFGEWAATLISNDPPPADPNIRQALEEAQAVRSPGPRHERASGRDRRRRFQLAARFGGAVARGNRSQDDVGARGYGNQPGTARHYP